MESFSWTLSFACGKGSMLALGFFWMCVGGERGGAYYDSRGGRHGGDLCFCAR